MLLSTTALTKAYGPVRALDTLDVIVPAGVTGLVGANGVSMSTFFRILLGLTRPDSETGQVGRRRIPWEPSRCVSPNVEDRLR